MKRHPRAKTLFCLGGGGEREGLEHAGPVKRCNSQSARLLTDGRNRKSPSGWTLGTKQGTGWLTQEADETGNWRKLHFRLRGGYGSLVEAGFVFSSEWEVTHVQLWGTRGFSLKSSTKIRALIELAMSARERR